MHGIILSTAVLLLILMFVYKFTQCLEQAWTCGSCMILDLGMECSVLGLGNSDWNGAFKIKISGLGMNNQTRSVYLVLLSVEWSVRLRNRVREHI